MPNYCVNTNAQSGSNDHEVHDLGTCNRLPNLENRKALGWHADCKAAVREAKKSYSDVNGCYYCCPDCNTG